MQKFFDQAISGNWAYNPENYPDGEVPVSVMANDLLTTYKMGWKTSYYQNTYDGKKEEEPAHSIGWHEGQYPLEDLSEGRGPGEGNDINKLIDDLMNADESECDGCYV